LKKSLDEKEKIRGRLQEKCSKLESKLTLSLKKRKNIKLRMKIQGLI